MTELNIFEQSIARDNASIEAAGAAITNIEQGITHVKKAVKSSQSNLSAVKESKARVVTLGPHTKNSATTTSDAYSYVDILNRVDSMLVSGTSGELKHLEEQEHELQTRINYLLSMLSSLERELQDWKVERVIAQQSLQFHIRSKDETSWILQTIARLLSSIKRVPADVWREIFLVDVIYSREQPLNPRGSDCMHAFSQVCREWRVIALDTPELWNRIEIAPVSWWPNSEYQRVIELLRRSSGTSIELVYDLQRKRDWETQAMASHKIGTLYLHSAHFTMVCASRPRTMPPQTSDLVQFLGFTPTSETYYRKEKKPTYQKGYSGTERQDLVSISGDLISQPYSIHFSGVGDGRSVGDRMATNPFRQPKLVAIKEPTLRLTGPLKQMLAPFDQLEKLILVNLSPIRLNDLTEPLNRLKYLRLEGQAMFYLEVTPNIEELHIQDHSYISWNIATERASLLNLHTLSITLEQLTRLPLIDAPLLKTLTLDAVVSASTPGLAIYGLGIGLTQRLIKRINVRNWPGETGSPGLEGLIQRVFACCRVLNELELNHCHIDSSALQFMQKIPRLEVLTLAYCSGITQADCESLKRRVGKLHVYV